MKCYFSFLAASCLYILYTAPFYCSCTLCLAVENWIFSCLALDLALPVIALLAQRHLALWQTVSRFFLPSKSWSDFCTVPTLYIPRLKMKLWTNSSAMSDIIWRHHQQRSAIGCSKSLRSYFIYHFGGWLTFSESLNSLCSMPPPINQIW